MGSDSYVEEESIIPSAQTKKSQWFCHENLTVPKCSDCKNLRNRAWYADHKTSSTRKEDKSTHAEDQNCCILCCVNGIDAVVIPCSHMFYVILVV